MHDSAGRCRTTITIRDSAGRRRRLVATLSAALLLSGCGSYTLPVETAPTGGSNASGTFKAENCDQLFSLGVQPRLDYCRNCHVPGGVADVPDGKLYMLSQNKSEDFANLHTSWERLGRNDNGKSRILKMASGTDTRSHTGGTPWPVGSDAYKAVDALLLGFVDPQACVLTVGGTQTQEFPLLGSMHGRSAWQVFCEGNDDKTPQADSAALPVNPVTKVRPGFNANKAVYFNAYWDDCHAALPASEQPPKTCGEYRARRDLGEHMLREGFETDNGGKITAAAFNDTWKSWGLNARPANFDEMYTLRYGDNRPNYPNPYPVRKADGSLEDPNAPGVNGGSGQLPLGYRQLKDASGKWTSTIGTEACAGCHGGQIGDPGDGPGLGGMYGLGNANTDPTQAAIDSNSQTGGIQQTVLDTGLGFGLLSGQRGQSDAVTAFELLDFVLLDWDSAGLAPNPSPAKYPGTHPRSWQDAPNWWNTGHRARKFFAADVSIDAHRILSAAGSGPSLLTPGAGAQTREYINKYDKALAAYQDSVRSPSYPESPALGGPINTALAEQGAILFHTKDLFAQPGNANRPKPLGGNGSCASCHGAYSPRFVHDTSYLEDPAMEGVAAHISPIAVIGTDSARTYQLSSDFADVWDTSWWSYPEGQPGYVPPENKNAAVELADDQYALIKAGLRTTGVCTWRPSVIGYQAPPLYGIWATAPYFHNGSVPTVEQVLDSSKRPEIWRRKLQTIGPVTGFDQSLKTAYDFQNMGWKHDVLTCDSYATDPFLSCNPVDPSLPSIGTLALSVIQANFVFSGAVNPQYLHDPQRRLIVDTRVFAESRTGHEFTDVLTEQERRAIIEYLKTL